MYGSCNIIILGNVILIIRRKKEQEKEKRKLHRLMANKDEREKKERKRHLPSDIKGRIWSLLLQFFFQLINMSRLLNHIIFFSESAEPSKKRFKTMTDESASSIKVAIDFGFEELMTDKVSSVILFHSSIMHCILLLSRGRYIHKVCIWKKKT